MIPAAELAALQATVNTSLDLSIQVKRSTRTKTASGHFTEVWNNVGSPVPGNAAQPTGGLMQNYGYAIGDEDSWMVRVPTGTNVQVNDRVVFNSQTIRVEFILQPMSYQTALRLLGSAVQSGEVE